MDAVDELIAPFLSSSPDARRNRAVLVGGLVSAALVLAVHHVTLGDVDTSAWQRVDSPDWAGGSLLLFVLAPLAVWLLIRHRVSRWRLAIGVLLVPALALIVGLLNADNRRYQRGAHQVFSAYTGRFPRAALIGDPYVLRQYSAVVTICQQRTGRGHRRDFCAEMVMTWRRGHQVSGGFEYDPLEGSPRDGPVYRCW